ncbi:MAG: glycosyltransferase family 2 protein [Halieaceae bacterium]|jgi:GT2 family glycosyltransferase|nr:glycosyltransferase family 2 protein [Halieaceae bacterium]
MSNSVAVIIVNYGTGALAIEAAQSVLEREHGGAMVSIHIVDNASPNDDAARLSAWLSALPGDERDRVTLHLEAENHGFGRGNNVALEFLERQPEPPSRVFLLNPDARLENEAIALMSACMDEHPAVAVIGAGVSYDDGEPASAAYRFPSAISEFVAAVNFGPLARVARRWQVAIGADARSGPVDWVTGAAVLARFEALREIGFFDPVYFLYFEEVDLMRRLKRRGHQVWHLREARVIHAKGAATGVSARGDEIRRRRPPYWYESWYHYFRRNHGWFGAAIAATAWYSGALLNIVIAALRGQPRHCPAHFFDDFTRIVARRLANPFHTS